MRRTNRAVGLAAALVMSATSSCGTPDGPSETPSPVTSAPDNTATTSPDDTTATTSAPTEAELDDAGQQAAAEAVVEFWAMLDELSQDPSIEVTELGRVARGQAADQWVSNIQGRRDRNSVQTGDTVVTVTDVQTVEEGQQYEVTACLDFSDVQFNGETPERRFEDGAQITYVLRPDALSEGKLFVTDDPLEYEPCGS